MLLRAKISKGGKVVIPVLYRKQLHLKEGEEVFFDIQNDHLIMSSLRNTLEKVRQKINQHFPQNESLVDKLIAERREEASRE